MYLPISHISLYNIGRHKTLEIDLDKGFNVIVGPNRSGKSTLLRAINWAFFNRSTGNTEHRDSIIRAGAKVGRVSITLQNGTKIIREKSVSGRPNRYILLDKVYDAVGRNIPDEINRIIGCYPFVMPNEPDLNLNFQNQMDKAFLLNLSGPSRTRFFHHIAGSSILETAASEGKREAFSLKREYSILEKEYDEIKKEISPLQDKVDKCRDKSNRIRVLLKLKDRLQTKINVLIQKQKSLLSCRNILNKINKQKNHIYEQMKNCETIMLKYERAIIQYESLQKYQEAMERIKEIKSIIQSISNKISSLRKEIDDIEKEISSAIVIDAPCPFSGARLPRECVLALKQ